MIDQVRCRLRYAPSVAGRAYPSPFAGTGNEKIMATFRATRPCETMGQNATFELAAELPLDIEWHRTAIPGAFSAKAKIGFEVLLYHSRKYCLGGMPWAVWTQIGGAEI